MLLAAAVLSAAAPMPAAPARQRVAAADIVAAARARVDAQLGADAAGAGISVIGTPEDILVAPGKLALKAHALSGRWPRARAGVPVDVSVDGRVVRSATVWFALSVHRQELAYAQDAAVGTASEQLKLTPQDEDVAAASGQLVLDAKELQGLRLRHPAQAGAPVLRTDFEAVPAVDRKQRVVVLAAYGVIRLQTHGVAARQGGTGEVIPVLVDGAETPVSARVTDKGVVEVVQ